MFWTWLSALFLEVSFYTHDDVCTCLLTLIRSFWADHVFGSLSMPTLSINSLGERVLNGLLELSGQADLKVNLHQLVQIGANTHLVRFDSWSTDECAVWWNRAKVYIGYCYFSLCNTRRNVYEKRKLCKQSALCSHGMEFSHHKHMLISTDICFW